MVVWEAAGVTEKSTYTWVDQLDAWLHELVWWIHNSDSVYQASQTSPNNKLFVGDECSIVFLSVVYVLAL